jgi:hypothetical protein
MGVDANVAPAKLGAAFAEDRLVAVAAGVGRLVRGGPGVARRNITQIAEAAPGSQVVSSRQRVNARSFQRL